MRAKEFLIESRANISQHADGGDLEGYVVNTTDPAIRNYLESQGASENLIDKITQTYERVGLLRNLFVDTEARNRGIGSRLVSDAIDSASYNEAQAILLVSDASEDNEFDLTQWYENFGFEVVGQAGTDPVMILNLI
jgi:ribosomal protein S18 acetylase RimI-like enzyme